MIERIKQLGLPVWHTDDGAVVLVQGDCLDVLPTLEAGSVDCVITDPPYGTRTDQRTDWMIGEHSNVMPLLLPVIHHSCSPTAAFYSFTSWKWMADWILRCSPYFRMQNFLIWDKGRHSGCYGAYSWQFHWEGIYFGIKGARKVRRYLPDVLRSSDSVEHPMQKPTDLLVKLIEASTDSRELVCDPYAGTGSTACAAIQSGRRFVGCEISPEYFGVAVARIEAELARAPLFEPAPVIQRSLLENPA